MRSVVDQQHADLEPLLLAVTERASRLSAPLGETDTGQCRGDAITAGWGQMNEEHAPSGAGVGERELEILKDSQVFENGRSLKLAANPEIGDFRLV